MTTYVVATVKPWNMAAFFAHTVKLPGTWELVSNEKSLADVLKMHNPRYVFFPHWSWKVPEEIIDRYECVCFHMTDLPFGKGGSPLQNLILRGHHNTVLTAFRMTNNFDDGPIYLKTTLSLEGRAEEIYMRAAELSYQMMEKIITDNPMPCSQVGEPVPFKRRTPAESHIPSLPTTTDSLYDFIRMLDAPTYPLAFIDWGDFRIQFHHAEKINGVIEAKCIIRRRS